MTPMDLFFMKANTMCKFMPSSVHCCYVVQFGRCTVLTWYKAIHVESFALLCVLNELVVWQHQAPAHLAAPQTHSMS